MHEDCIYKTACETECKSACMRYAEMNYMLKNSNIPKAKQKVNTLIPDTCDIKSFEYLANIRNSIVDFTNSGGTLYIYSNTCGNGKTTWSIKLMLQYFHEMWAGNGFTKRGVFVSVPTFLYDCKANISKPSETFEQLKEDLSTVDMVVWDDIAASKLSEYDYNMLFAIIDRRILNEKSNIFTGNIEPNNLYLHLGERLASRLLDGNIVCLKGGDKRGTTPDNQ